MNTGGIAGADAFAVTIGTGHDKRPGRDAEANGLWVLQHPRRPSVGPRLNGMPARLIDRPTARARQPRSRIRHRQIVSGNPRRRRRRGRAGRNPGSQSPRTQHVVPHQDGWAGLRNSTPASSSYDQACATAMAEGQTLQELLIACALMGGSIPRHVGSVDMRLCRCLLCPRRRRGPETLNDGYPVIQLDIPDKHSDYYMAISSIG